jgi:hypothetical protein
MATQNTKSGQSYPLSLTFKDKGNNVVPTPANANITWQVINTSPSGSLGTITVDPVNQGKAAFNAGTMGSAGYLKVTVEQPAKQPIIGRNNDDLLVITGDADSVVIIIDLSVA